MSVVEFFSRPDCHLCHRALETLRELQKELHFEIQLIDISGSEDLEKLYGNDIPIATLNSRVILRHRADEKQLRQILTSAD